jgi:hypothetical protein
MKCEKVTIETFIDAWFSQDYENISKEDFDLVYAEYIDLAGLYKSKEFELTTYINYLKNRIKTLQLVISSQEMYFEVFKKPYIPGLEFVKEKFGFSFTWTENEKQFFSFLRKLSANQRVKETELKHKQFEFNKIKEEKLAGDVSNVQSRHEFIKMLNSLSKNGYKVDRKNTYVEELALMIKQISDESTKLAGSRI